ncbi:MAG: C40 family peptidase, partial [Clostridia bacterium]|nr:C40 family peptidase [Clostridia bacterium]
VNAPVHVHTYSGEWQISTAPTIFSEGQKYRSCDLASCDEKEIVTLPAIEVVSIKVTTKPSKVEYISSESFDPSGLIIKAIGADDSETDVTALVSYNKTVLTYTDTTVTASYKNKSCEISILVKRVYGVSEALTDAKDSENILVEGIYVGVADEGSGYDKELLLKDKNSDKLISVIGVTYGEFPAYGYMKGDLVRIEGTLTKEVYIDGDTKTQNKTFVAFAGTNPENIDDTIISHGNTVSFKLTDVVEITSWAEMKEYFTPDNVQAYTYVHFTGTVWFNTYTKAGDGVLLHRFSMNSSATSLDYIKPDGKRAVGFRENVIKANTPALMSGSFAEAFGATNYPGKKTTVDFYAVITATNGVNYQLTILETNWVAGGAGEVIKIENNQDIVREVAYAYYRQGSQIYYDQSWRATNFSPEEATAQKHLNLDCSSYVNSVYYEAFGYNVLGVPISQKGPTTENFTSYARDNLGIAKDVIGYWETADYTDAAVQKQLLLDIQSSLEVGDIIVFRRGKTEATSGHTLIYVGGGKFLHSTGSKCTYDEANPESSKDVCSKTEYQNGTIGLLNTSELFTNTSSSRYLFKKTDSETIFTFCQIRPLALNLTPTEKTENRVKIAGVDVEKTVSPGVGAAVCRGETITYTLEIKNYSSNRYTGVIFEEILSENVEFVSGSDCIRLDGQRLIADLTIAGGDHFVISWTVRVKADAENGARIESKNTTIGGMNIFATENYVSAYTDAELQLVADKAKELAASGNYADPIEFAKAVYKEALGVDVFDAESTAALLESILTIYNGGTRYTVNADSEYADITLADISIGRLMSTALHDSVNIVEEDLEVGDLIFCEWTKGQRLFVYVGNNEFVMVDTLTGTPSVVSGGEQSYVLNNSSYVLQNLYNSLRSYPKCVVMRPSISTK